jgi:subtilisin family serine protease
LAVATGRPDVTGRFIVTLAPRTNPAAVAREHRLQPDFVYTHVFSGFAGRISDAARAGLLRDNRVIRVEADGIATIVAAPANTQTNATWGLDRVDQERLPLSSTYGYTNTGQGVTAYIIDTGILFGHGEFGGRASTGYDAVTAGGTGADCNGHGTHVAGTVGGATYGVAKQVKLVAVRVLGCTGSGTWSGVIAGMDWVTGNHLAGAPAVANMSLGGGANSSVDAAVQRMINDGVATAVAAGNGNQGGVAQDACKYSPARVGAAITIGATDKTDRKASWSNYGNCVDWFAPGVGITSAWHTNTSATNTISGTSMATPHTAGVAALYLQSNPGASPQSVRTALYDATTKLIVTSSKTANNHLLFTEY